MPAVVAAPAQVRYRDDTGVRPRGVQVNPPLLAASRVIDSPVEVFPPPDSSTTAAAVTREAVQAMAASHLGPALNLPVNPPDNPAAKRPIALAGKAKAEAHARVNNQTEATTGRKTPVHVRATGQTLAITGQRTEATPAAIARRREQTVRRTVRTAARTVPKHARTV